jgi:hypothetical protein
VPLAETMVQTRKATVESTNAMEATKSAAVEATHSAAMEPSPAAVETPASTPAMPSVGEIWLAERGSA